MLHIGWQLGSDAEVQVANPAINHLTSAIMKYFKVTGRWEQGINLFHRLRQREPEVDLLLAQLYLEMGTILTTPSQEHTHSEEKALTLDGYR